MTRISESVPTHHQVRATARLALVQRQRRFEWELARDEQTRVASALVTGKTHDLINLVQIIQFVTVGLQRHCGEGSKEFLADLVRAAGDAQRTLASIMDLARSESAPRRGPAVGAIVTRVLAEIRPAVAVDAHLSIAPDTATGLGREELEHLLIGLALDAVDAERDGNRIELYVRERTIDGKAWVELVRGTDATIAPDGFDLRAVDLLAKRAGGELARSDRRGGGTEVVVALPAL